MWVWVWAWEHMQLKHIHLGVGVCVTRSLLILHSLVAWNCKHFFRKTRIMVSDILLESGMALGESVRDYTLAAQQGAYYFLYGRYEVGLA